MSESSQVLPSVEWYYPELADEVEPIEDLDFYGVDRFLGFLAVNLEGRDLNLVGFTNHRADSSPAEPFYSITALDQLPEHERTIDRQGKGVGQRLYNTPQAVAGTLEHPAQVDAVLFSFDRNELVDLRTPQSNTNIDKGRRIIRHAGRIARSFGSEARLSRVIDDIHASFGDARVVFQPQPPHSEIRRTLRHVEPDHVLRAEAFALIRDPSLPLHIVGTARSTY